MNSYNTNFEKLYLITLVILHNVLKIDNFRQTFVSGNELFLQNVLSTSCR